MARNFDYDENGFSPEIQRLVEDYLSKKKRVAHFYVEVEEEDDGNMDPDWKACYLIPFAEEDIAALKSLIKKYGEDDYLNHQDESPEVAELLSCYDHWRKIVDINFRFPQYTYTYSRHYLTIGERKKVRGNIIISDEDYAKLLYIGITEGPLCFNYLAEQDETLFDSLDFAIRKETFNKDSVYLDNHTPFLVTLDEAETDVNTILQQNPDLKQFLIDQFDPRFCNRC